MFTKILVANRGEIAVRILRSCQEMGISTVTVYASNDRLGRHVQLAEEAYLLRGEALNDTYLNINQLVDIAQKSGAQAIHPGYGFLAENADFAQACHQAGLVFIGPLPDTIRAMGSKLEARKIMQAAGVPVTPGSPHVSTLVEVKYWATQIGYPLLVKASAGGGGRGLKMVEKEQNLEKAFIAATREGQNYFGDPTVYLEKLIQNPRHVEVQILADQHQQVIHLGERDCSIQRRHQKLFEETPAPNLPEPIREQLHEVAVKGATAIHYIGAGTFEFLVKDEDIYFLEVNTRLQVEHPVTEMVTGIDMVKEQIRIASGEHLGYSQSDIHFNGHAVEARITIEDAHQNFLPQPGQITDYQEPAGFGVRVDSMAYAGYEIPGSYDSLITKLVAWGRDREEALNRMARALKEYRIEGIITLLPFYQWLVTHPIFRQGHPSTAFLETHFNPSVLPASPPPSLLTSNPTERQEMELEINGKYFKVAFYKPRKQTTSPPLPTPPGSKMRTEKTNKNSQTILSPMAGTVLSVSVQSGDTVSLGDVLFVIESMKMENDLTASQSGTVAKLYVKEGDLVQAGDILLEFAS